MELHIPRLALGPDEVHVWQLHADRIPDDLLPGLLALLSADEHARHQCFTHARSRREYLLARCLVRSVLAGLGGLDPHDLSFTVNAFGKPDLVRAQEDLALHFNLSHSHGVVVLAVTRTGPVGIDVEHTGRPTPLLELAERYFAAEEVAHLHRLTEEQRIDAFFATWTLKEAFVKAVGRGLTLALDSFAFELDGDRFRGFRPIATSGDEAWHFVQFRPTDCHYGALAINGAAATVHVNWHDWLDLFRR